MKQRLTIDNNPERIRCALCGDTDGMDRRVTMLPGPVCSPCIERLHPESAPYWQDAKQSISPGQRTTLGRAR